MKIKIALVVYSCTLWELINDWSLFILTDWLGITHVHIHIFTSLIILSPVTLFLAVCVCVWTLETAISLVLSLSFSQKQNKKTGDVRLRQAINVCNLWPKWPAVISALFDIQCSTEFRKYRILFTVNISIFHVTYLF